MFDVIAVFVLATVAGREPRAPVFAGRRTGRAPSRRDAAAPW
jgi:hypothetical protein